MLKSDRPGPSPETVNWTLLVEGRQTLHVVKTRLWYDARSMGASLLGLILDKVDAICLDDFK